jgi:nucleoside-diphosphate-sugar epimerase
MSDTVEWLRVPNTELMYGDLSHKESLSRAVKGIEVVYHLAIDYSHPTTDDVRNLIDVCLAEGVKRFIYFSSIATVGLSNVIGIITEETPCRSDTEYSRLKRTGEELLLEAHAKHGFPVVIVRPTSVYGPGETNFWLPLFQAIAMQRLPLLFGNGTNILSLCFIDNLIEGALRAAQHDAAVGQVYIISDERPYTLQEVSKAIAEVCNVPLPQRIVPKLLALPAARLYDYLWRLELMEPVVPFLASNVERWIAHYHCSVDKAAGALGYCPRIGLQEGVRRTVEWYQQKGFLCHSLQWSEGLLDMSALPGPSDKGWDCVLRSSGQMAEIMWRLMALTWRLPPKLIRRMRRQRGGGRG